MIAEKITSCVAKLGDLAGKVSPEVRETLSCVRRELRDAAEQAEAMEGRAYISEVYATARREEKEATA